MLLRWIAVAIVGNLLSACATQPPPAESTVNANSCTEPRPMVCTMEYLPVCAVLADGSRQTYPSGCNACADVAVQQWEPAPCEEQ